MYIAKLIVFGLVAGISCGAAWSNFVEENYTASFWASIATIWTFAYICSLLLQEL